MRLALAALAAIVPLAACTAAPVATTAAGASSGEVLYCWKDRLGAGENLDCNWQSSKDEACKTLTFSKVTASRYSEPKTATLCPNGQWLVEVRAKS